MATHPSSFILHPSRLPHRLAWVLACVTFPLVWMGGLVTTYGAGMAVPDWPNTFGYNLFLYPLESWLGVWDVFLEHSHRLLAATAGFVTIALAVAVWRQEPRRWVRWLGAAALAGVCFQGVLGGLRVTENAVWLAKIHGCTAPLFFVLCTSLVAFTSPAWRQDRAAAIRPAAPILPRLAPAMAAGIYLQIVLGAQLRHHDPALAPGWFTLWLWLHVLAAGGLAIGARGLVRLTGRQLADAPTLRRRGRWLLVLLLVQLDLGAAAWVTHYNWPAWLTGWTGDIEYTVVTSSFLQAVLTTAHVAVGSLALAAATSLCWWALWVLRPVQELAAATELENHSQSRRVATCGLSTCGLSTRGLSTRGLSTRGRCGATNVGDWWQLVRPRILGMVLFTMTVATLSAGDAPPAWPVLVHALGGSGLLIAGAIALNQRLELRSDARMKRTGPRPLPSGRLSVRQATWFGILASAGGIGWLALALPPMVALVGLVSWIVYVWLYTPLKLLSAWQTPLGALAGAAPILMGAAAAGAPGSVRALTLFGIVYFWQFPHAMAIAWLWRDDFAAAGLRVATVVDPSGRTAAAVSLLGASLLVPVSLVPAWAGLAGGYYLAAAAILGLCYLAASINFGCRSDGRSARIVLRVSLVYLPAICAAVLAALLW